METFKLVI